MNDYSNDLSCDVSVHLHLIKLNQNISNPVAVHGAEAHLITVCIINIMIVCLFGRVTFSGASLTQTSAATPSTPPSLSLSLSLCTTSMHTTVYPINSFTIYNYLFSLSTNRNIATKRGIKLGLFSHSKNKKQHYVCFLAVSQKPRQPPFSWTREKAKPKHFPPLHT